MICCIVTMSLADRFLLGVFILVGLRDFLGVVGESSVGLPSFDGGVGRFRQCCAAVRVALFLFSVVLPHAEGCVGGN